eukprot:scaffold7131_cov131-Isochrysis_galbana.AAC.1
MHLLGRRGAWRRLAPGCAGAVGCGSLWFTFISSALFSRIFCAWSWKAVPYDAADASSSRSATTY